MCAPCKSFLGGQRRAVPHGDTNLEGGMDSFAISDPVRSARQAFRLVITFIPFRHLSASISLGLLLSVPDEYNVQRVPEISWHASSI